MPLPFLLRRSWESRGLFRQSPPRALLYVSPFRKPPVHCRALWGAGRFHTASPEVGKPRGLFHQRMPRTLLYGSLPR